MVYAVDLSKRHGKSVSKFPGLMLGVMLAIFGLLAYVAYPASNANAVPQRLTAASGGGSSSSDSSSSIREQTSVSTVAAAVGTPAAGSASLGMLDHILPLTNFSSLTSARLMDAAVAKGLKQQQLRQLMQLHQELYCSSKMHLSPLPGTTKVPFGNVTLHVYDGKDIVSGELAGEAHSWEAGETQQMLWALKQYTSQQQAAVAAKRSSSRLQQQQQQQQQQQSWLDRMPLFVDVGANVGWFTLNAAAAGARVAAFEAMPSNIQLIRRSLCSNPWLAERTALYGTGLGVKSSSCAIISGSTNRGDGHTVCDKDVGQVLAEAKGKSNETYEVRGEMSVRRLDSVLSEDVQVMKVDVEGFELQVLEGAQGLLERHNVWYIMAECNGGIITAEGQKKYLRYLDRMGYYISSSSFQGPFMKQRDVAAGTAHIPQFANLYCVRKELLSPGLVKHITE